MIVRIVSRIILSRKNGRERQQVMIIKHYFLNELERETYEKKVVEQDAALQEEAILELDDRELLELYESKQYAYSM